MTPAMEQQAVIKLLLFFFWFVSSPTVASKTPAVAQHTNLSLSLPAMIFFIKA